FQKSAMTCGSCHNPHRAERGSAAARCVQCHAKPHAPQTDCAGCHMPKRATDDVVRVEMTDHFIQRRPVLHAPAAKGPYRGPVALYYPERLPQSPENEAYLAVAQTQHGSNLEEGIPRLEAAIARLAPAGPEF